MGVHLAPLLSRARSCNQGQGGVSVLTQDLQKRRVDVSTTNKPRRYEGSVVRAVTERCLLVCARLRKSAMMMAVKVDEQGHGAAQEVSPHWTTRYTMMSHNAPNTAFSAHAVNGAFICLAANGFFALLAVNCFMSILSVNSIMSMLSVNSAFSIGCSGQSFKCCIC
ncbi:hypothetical protein T484DRAFT_3039601 [Baffinella frigidus]|nr:hypothetical protein T484DRAFT_3039601 [Cryptophyta sp. CCMP2293]